MHITVPTDPRTSEIGKILETEQDIELFQQHLKEVIEGAAFKASQRSGQFLKYIVDQAIAGHFESLKERVIGIELFGRSPSYDTGEDAIVRVTASDVRKRLLQHYGGKDGATSEFRISLPLGAYIPEIARRTRSSANGNSHLNGTVAEPDQVADMPHPDLLQGVVHAPLHDVAVESSRPGVGARIPRLSFIAALCTLALIAAAVSCLESLFRGESGPTVVPFVVGVFPFTTIHANHYQRSQYRRDRWLDWQSGLGFRLRKSQLHT